MDQEEAMLKQELSDENIRLREALKKNCVFYDIGLKGGWVPGSKHNFFYIRN